MSVMKKQIRGFTLIEIILALGFLSILALAIMPSINSMVKMDEANKEDSKIVFALEEAIESTYLYEEGRYSLTINSYPIDVEISPYEGDDKLLKVKASFEDLSLDLVRER
ncbi:MAG: type II secretion system protein [Anaerococcus sp.]|nr:type II secretion system protein [Anaerococcus sp.]